MLSAIDRLRLFLRPPGMGLYTHSTGGVYAAELLQTLYGTAQSAQIQRIWEESLQRVRRGRVILLGIPSDTGAGIMRGANFGPIGIRSAFVRSRGHYPKDVLDLGDVICVPQLLHDDMLSEAQISQTRSALYPNISEPLPVSPLSIAEEVFYAIAELNPRARVCVLGGDHSVSWPALLGCTKRYGGDFGVLHFDAHTDLLDSRLGVRYCFATWAFHVVTSLRPRAFVQVGVRASRKGKDFWEKEMPVVQHWASEVLADPGGCAQKILDHFASLGLKRIYISNDIDGTDVEEAPATGTPEKFGLRAEWIEELMNRVKDCFEVVGGDVVEVAPPLSGSRDFYTEKTCLVAARYLNALL